MYNLPPEIQHQKDLMQQALNKLYLLEHVPDIINKFDSSRAVVIKEDLQREYCTAMVELSEVLILQSSKINFEL